MDRIRYISVPLNSKGVEETKNIKVFELAEKDSNELYSKAIFEEINNKCSLLIDDYESEIIDSEKTSLVGEILKDHTLESKIFIEALNLADSSNTLIGLGF